MDRPQQSVLHAKEQKHSHGPSHGSQRRNFKLIVDPQLKKGQEKLIRFDGEFYSSNNHGQRPVVVRDPRTHSTKLWSRREKVDLPVPRYKVDEWYLGAVPPREITFSKLNDNITKQFMEQLCGKYGKLERVKVYHHPKTGKHMGLAKVVFASIKSASICIERLHQTSIMGNVINAELDGKGELLKKLHHKIIRGELVADTMPDVIKHTQEKPKSRPHKIHSQRRKSSVDDPRRKSLESLERRRSVEQSSAAGPRTPPIDVPETNIKDHSDSRVPPVHPQEHPVHSSTNHSPHPAPPLSVIPNAHSLESGYGSHPGSASMVPDQASPFGLVTTSEENPEILNHDESIYAEHRDASKLLSEAKNKLLKFGNESKLKVWTKDLQNRIESLINEQNEKYNLGTSKKQIDVNDEHRDHVSPRDRHPSDEGCDVQVSARYKDEAAEDLEDGECSGDDGAEDESPVPVQISQPITEQLEKDVTPPVQSKESPPTELSETSRQRFSRSPSPSFRYPHEHSPRMRDRLVYDGRHDRYSPPPADYFHRRIRPPSPGRPPVEFGDRAYHSFGARPPSPSFGLHRRHSPPYDSHHRLPRSPGFDHHHHHHHHHHHRFSPPRRRPPSPGFPRHREMRPGPSDFVPRRSPSPSFRHHRRSPSPMRKFTGPLIRREFDYSPHRDRMFYSPRDVDRHHGGYSPRHPDYERHRRKSPDLRRRSPEPVKLRDHRELPPEFRERWSHHGPPSPHHARVASHSSRPTIHPQRFKSSSPETLQSTPPRIRSPARMRPDQKPYSPGDLPMDDSLASASVEPSQVAASDSDSENLSLVGASKRKERESSDHDAPLISLDERLREITGEPPPEEPPADSSPKLQEEVTETNHNTSPPASEDMEISSGGGSSEHGDHPAMHFKQPPQPEMGFRPRGFRPPFLGPHDQPWRCNGPGPQMMWNEFNPRFHMNQRPMWRPPPDNMMRFPPNMHNGFPQPMMNHPPMDRGFNNQMLPPPPPGWNRPWVQGHLPPMGPMNNFEMNKAPMQMVEPRPSDPKQILSNFVLGRITNELKDIIKRDLNKKVIETMAFKAYEAWWDKEEALKNPKLVTGNKPSAATGLLNVKTETNVDGAKDSKLEADTKSSKMPALLNTFDPLNWAKGSFEMDGFRIGLGFRSAISKMPSFRVKKRTPSPVSVPEKKMKLDSGYQKSKVEKDKPEGPRKRIWLDSEGEEEDESEQESSDEDEEEAKHGKSRVLHVEDVFSSSSGSEDEESTDEEDEEESEEESDEEQLSEITRKEFRSDGMKRSPSPSSQEPPRKKHRIGYEEQDRIQTEKVDNNVSLAAVSLSELQSGVRLPSSSLPPESTSSEMDFRHLHPKKRFRMLSKDETHNLDLIAEVSNRLRSDDEVSTMSDKEKAALEVLQEMKTTPERRVSATNRYSESSDSMDFVHPATPSRPSSEGILSPVVPRRSVSNDSFVAADSNAATLSGNKSSLPPLFNQSKKSDEEELEAVEALLSIKQSHPLVPPISPTSSTAVQDDFNVDKTDESRKYKLSQKDQNAMAALAEEHNYFATSLDRKPVIDPALLQLLEEHNYSLPPSQAPKPSPKRDRLRSHSEALYDFALDDTKSTPSAAESVKLRRESKTSKHAKPHLVDDVVERKSKPAKFRSRSRTEQSALLYLMWSTGLDLEDMRYLRNEYEQLLTQSNVPQWANDTHWTAHPVTNIPNPESSPTSKKSRRRKNKKKTDQNDVKVHETGCARSEGYYKVADKTKLIQRRLMYRHADNSEPVSARQGKSTASSSGTTTGTENTREARHMMRRIAYEFGSDASDLLKYNQLMFRKKSVKFKRSRIHGWGLFAQETIGADEMVIEYVGQLVRTLVADRREADYTKRGIGSSYLFRIDSDHIIDATKCGNYARFMNHSCDPSCYAKVITVEGAKKIVIYSKNVIKPTEEITYDYKFPIEDTKIPCFCGAINCRGTLN